MPDISPEVQKQLEAAKKNCIFCKLISGQMQAKKVYEDEKLSCLLDINPWVKGHLLMMPNEHYPIMPFLPQDVFMHMFGKLPKIVKCLKQAMVATGINVFIANGAVAGQQSPHFLVHLLPRDEDDAILNFRFDMQEIEEKKHGEALQILRKNIPIMMNNHLQRIGMSYPGGLKAKTEELLLYEDSKLYITTRTKPYCVGHVVIRPKKDTNLIEDLSEEDSWHLFYAASYSATAVFEGLGAAGSNIILKSGTSTDNPEGQIEVHVLPRFEGDSLDVNLKPMKDKPDLDDISKSIKDSMFVLENHDEEINETDDKLKEVYDAIKKIID